MNLSTKVLEAGGGIESRCTNPPEFVTYYVFTREQLEKYEQLSSLGATKPCSICQGSERETAGSAERD